MSGLLQLSGNGVCVIEQCRYMVKVAGAPPVSGHNRCIVCKFSPSPSSSLGEVLVIVQTGLFPPNSRTKPGMAEQGQRWGPREVPTPKSRASSGEGYPRHQLNVPFPGCRPASLYLLCLFGGWQHSSCPQPGTASCGTSGSVLLEAVINF